MTEHDPTRRARGAIATVGAGLAAGLSLGNLARTYLGSGGADSLAIGVIAGGLAGFLIGWPVWWFYFRRKP